MSRALTAFAFAITLTAALAGCVTINTGVAKPTTTTAPAAVGPAPVATTDYSGALNQLGAAIGALAKSSGAAPTAADCDYTGHTADTMEGATPDPAWQGTYETIRTNMHNIAALCAGDPTNADAIAEAQLTRPDVVKILNQESYLGQTNWG